MTRTSTSVAVTLAGAALLALPVAARAAPATVYSGAANWSVANVYDSAAPAGTNRTWLGYVTAPFTQGSATPSAGLLLSGPDGQAASVVGLGSPRGASEAYTFGFPLAGGTVDLAARSLDVTATGTLTFAVHGSAVAVRDPRLVLDGAGGGSVRVTGGTTAAGTTTPYDASTPLFSLDASAATFRQIGDGLVQISGLVPAIAKTEVFGAQYPVGSGPNRTPNTFGGFSVVVDTAAPQPAPTPTAPVTVERIVERPVERIVERTVQSDAAAPVVLRRTLARAPFGRGTAVDVALRRRGSSTVLGAGYVRGTRLVVVAPAGTTLNGRYVLRRQSGSARLARTAVVTLGATTSATTHAR